jgi:hypothetical protein
LSEDSNLLRLKSIAAKETEYRQELENARKEVAAELSRPIDYEEELEKEIESDRYYRCKADVIHRLALCLFRLEIIPYQQRNKVCARLVSDLQGCISAKEVRESVVQDWKRRRRFKK